MFYLLLSMGILCGVGAVNPVVIVPGLGGSVLEATLTNKPEFRDCKTNSDWYTIWVSESQMLFRFDCWESVFSLQISNDSLSNATGVDTRPYDYGGVSGVEYSTSGSNGIPMPYMKDLVEMLEGLGLQRDVSVRAATYDFRAAGDVNQTFQQYARLKVLIENTYEINDDKAVHLISHSLGGSYVSAFLNMYVSETWKATYIASYVSVSGAFLGTPIAMQGLISGPKYDFVPQVLPALLVPSSRTMPCMLWMMPILSEVFPPEQVLISTPSVDYTAQWGDIGAFLESVNATVLLSLYEDMKGLISAGSKPPGVPLFCGYAIDTKTALHLEYKQDDLSTALRAKVVEETMGDGTVTLDSLRHCASEEWKADLVRHEEYLYGGSLAAHTSIVSFPPLLEDIAEWITNDRWDSQ